MTDEEYRISKLESDFEELRLIVGTIIDNPAHIIWLREKYWKQLGCLKEPTEDG